MKRGPRRSRLSGQCAKCRNIYPETNKYFHECRRRGRIELRSVCKVCWNAGTRNYQKDNVDAVRAYNKARAKTPEYQVIRRAAWRKYHAKPEYREIDREQYRRTVSTPEGRERIRVKVRRRRARIKGSDRHHTASDVQCALEVQSGLCFYCHINISENYTVDHLIPLARGGSDGPENIVVACASCNFHKADRTPGEFASGITHRRRAWPNVLPELHS
jgi:5-methylcytosine-specific restriction endonuclease McrA